MTDPLAEIKRQQEAVLPILQRIAAPGWDRTRTPDPRTAEQLIAMLPWLTSEVERLAEENAELRAMLGRDGKDSGRMWYDRAQRLKRQRDEAVAEVDRFRAVLRQDNVRGWA